MEGTTAVDSVTVREIVNYNMDSYVLLVAAAVGVVIIIIGYFFSGGKKNKGAIFFSSIVSSLIGILVLPGFFALADILSFEGRYVNTAMVVFDIIFVALISCHAYEMVTVSAKEAHPD